MLTTAVFEAPADNRALALAFQTITPFGTLRAIAAYDAMAIVDEIRKLLDERDPYFAEAMVDAIRAAIKKGGAL